MWTAVQSSTQADGQKLIKINLFNVTRIHALLATQPRTSEQLRRVGSKGSEWRGSGDTGQMFIAECELQARQLNATACIPLIEL
jgi:hypothetical protein